MFWHLPPPPLPRFYFVAPLFTSQRSALSERLEQATLLNAFNTKACEVAATLAANTFGRKMNKTLHYLLLNKQW